MFDFFFSINGYPVFPAFFRRSDLVEDYSAQDCSKICISEENS